MKRTILSVIILLAVFALGFLLGSLKPQSLTATVAIAAPAPAAHAAAVPYRCPAIHDAIHALVEAERDMRETNHDFCGHKRAAMDITKSAIRELQAAEGCAQCR